MQSLNVNLEDERLKERMKIRKGLLFGTILVLFLLFFASVPTNVSADPGIWVYYDRNDPDVVLIDEDEPYDVRGAVKFTPPLTMFTSLYELESIKVMIAAGYQYMNEFGIEITDTSHDLIRSVPYQTGVPGDVWYTVDFGSSWTPLQINYEFYIEIIPAFDTSGNYVRTTGLWFDEDNAASGRSAWYTIIILPPPAPQVPVPLWSQLDTGDLMIRVEFKPILPESLVSELKGIVKEVDDSIFNGYAHNKVQQQKKTILKKLDVVINDFEECNYQGGYKKLANDIIPKLADPRPTPLADPRPTPRTSWLHKYPEGTQNQQAVSEFANECLELFELIRLADPRPTP